VTVEVVGDPARLVAALEQAGLEVIVDGARLRVSAPDDSVFDLVRDTAADAGLGILRLSRMALTLEDEFLSTARRNGS
jgi:hypothetical protein